ncbi:MAG: type II toxin-antitoxin system VapC family toxin [Pirellulaceae bacterium]
MIFLLDTGILIYMIRGLKAASPRNGRREKALILVQHCREAQQAGHAVGLSAVTVSELEFGARHSERYEDEIAAVRKILTPFELYDYDAVATPAHYGRIRADLEKRGLTVGGMDLLIAAHALGLNATVVTNNIVHFSRIPGLHTVNWLKHSPTA